MIVSADKIFKRSWLIFKNLQLNLELSNIEFNTFKIKNIAAHENLSIFPEFFNASFMQITEISKRPARYFENWNSEILCVKFGPKEDSNFKVSHFFPFNDLFGYYM